MAAAPPQTPLGELTALSKPPRGLLLRGGREREGDWREGGARPVCLLVLTILVTGLRKSGERERERSGERTFQKTLERERSVELGLEAAERRAG